MTEPVRVYSTNIARPVPPEYEATFVQGGWARVKHMFGKRSAVRYFTAPGPERLRAARDAFVRSKDRHGRNGHSRAD